MPLATERQLPLLDLQTHLKQHGIGSAVYYLRPLHLQACYESPRCKKGDLPVSERLAAETENAGLAPGGLDYICESKSFFHR